MKYEIIFFTTGTHSPVMKFIKNEITKSSHAKSMKTFDLIETYGIGIGKPHIKKITNKLYEARIKGGEEIRYLFCVVKERVIILHGFKKKKMKIDRKDIELANNRLKYI